MLGRIRHHSARQVNQVDQALVRQVAGLPHTGADSGLKRLSTAANHGGLWFAVAAILAAAKGPTRRAAVLSRSTPAELNARLAGAGADPMPLDRFRANIVDGWDEPSAEDRVRRLCVGDCDLGCTKLAIRCAVTTVDQEAGVKAGPEPLRTLARYRRAAAGGVAFGVKFSVLREGKLSVGDVLTLGASPSSDQRRRVRVAPSAGASLCSAHHAANSGLVSTSLE